MNLLRLYNSYKYKNVDYSEDTDWESIVCSKEDGHQRAGKRIGNLKIELTSKDTGDFLWTSLLNELIITDKTAKIFKENNITGYELKPVEVANNSDSYKLWEFVVTGWGGIASKNSGIELKESCNNCGHLIYSGFTRAEYLLDEQQWDGSDIFMIWPLPKFIFITDKVAHVIKSNKLLGTRFQTLDDLNEYSGGELSPGRLSRWMPEERARLIGEPLGIY